MLSFYLTLALLAALFLAACFFAALLSVVAERNELKAQLEQRDSEADEQQETVNDLRGRLTRKPMPYREFAGGRSA